MSTQLRLHFILDNYGKLFISGEKAKGVLKIYTSNETKVNKIKIGVIGKITIEADDNGNATTTGLSFYCSEEQIFDSPDLNDQDEQLIEFAIPLTNNLPPSIVLREGSIMYNLYATMEEEFADGTTQNVNTDAHISIATLIDCNHIPKAAKNKLVNKVPLNACLCIQRQEMNSLEISPRAYVPGDCIKITAVVFNSQSYPLCYVQAALIQKVKLRFEDKNVKTYRLVSETKRGCVLPQQVQVWHEELLRIPPLPPTTYHKHIQITYKLKVMIPGAQYMEAATSSVLEVPVMIGNLPLDSSIKYLSILPRSEQFNTTVLAVPVPYQDYARAENCLQSVEWTKFIPSYITYVTERAMDNIELE